MGHPVKVPWRRVRRCLNENFGKSGLVVYAAYNQVAYNGPQAALGWDSIFISAVGVTEMLTAEDPFFPWGSRRGPRWMSVPPGKVCIEAYRPRLLAPRSVDYALDEEFRSGDVGLLVVKPVEPFPWKRKWQPIWKFCWLIKDGVVQEQDLHGVVVSREAG